MIRRLNERAAIRSRHRRSGAFTLVETVICIVITSVMLAAALSATAAARLGMFRTTERQRGDLLAHDLMTEILAKYYSEPDGATGLGTDGGESSSKRSDFDDVDDYEGWSASPPVYEDGTEIPNLTKDWERTVKVIRVQEGNLNQSVAVETGIKKITVTVLRDKTPVATLSALRTCAR